MRLASSWVLAAALPIMSTATCFQHYQKQRAMSTTSSSSLSMRRGRIPPASTISISVSATTTANEVSSSSSSAIDEHHTITTAAKTYHEVNDLAFRALQRECKVLGLSAIGTTAALRQRLLEHFGLANPNSGGADITVPAVTAAEIEVSFALFLFALLQCLVVYFTSISSINYNLTFFLLIHYSPLYYLTCWC